jgi:hypothetical protein
MKLQRCHQTCLKDIRVLTGNVRKKTILKFYMTMVISSLLYGSECWTLTERCKGRLETAEMYILRAASGYLLIVHRRNEDIRKEQHRLKN